MWQYFVILLQTSPFKSSRMCLDWLLRWLLNRLLRLLLQRLLILRLVRVRLLILCINRLLIWLLTRLLWWILNKLLWWILLNWWVWLNTLMRCHSFHFYNTIFINIIVIHFLSIFEGSPSINYILLIRSYSSNQLNFQF